MTAVVARDKAATPQDTRHTGRLFDWKLLIGFVAVGGLLVVSLFTGVYDVVGGQDGAEKLAELDIDRRTIVERPDDNGEELLGDLRRPICQHLYQFGMQVAPTADGAAGPGDMGKVMGAVKAQLAGKADMGAVSAAVKAALSK